MAIQETAPGRVARSDRAVDSAAGASSEPAGSDWSALLQGANGVRSLALAGGVALHAINVYIATTILPSVVGDIGGLDLYAWNTTIFVVASIVASALSARLLQFQGPRGAYAVAAAIFALGSAACAFAPSMPIMLAGRFVQGFGGGFLLALAYSMIRIVFRKELWPRAMALVSGMWGVATLVGPAIGGIFAELGIWRAAFWSLIPISLLFMALAAFVLPRRDGQPSQRGSVPLTQISLLTAAVLAISAGSTSSDLTRNLAGIAAAFVLMGLLVRAEARMDRKLLPAGALRPGSPLGATYLTMSLLAVTVTGSEVFVPLFLQVLHGQSPLAAGYLAALMSAGWTLGSIASSGAGESGARRAITAGPLLSLMGTVALCILVPRSGAGTWLELAPTCVALVAMGFAVGLTWPHLLTNILKAAPANQQELAGASITTVQLFATATGAALAGMVANAAGLIDPGGLAGTANAARWLFGIFMLAPLICLVSARRAVRI